MKHILFVFFFVFGCAMPTMVYAQTNSGGVHTITRGGSKTKPSNSGTSNKKKPKVKKNTTSTGTTTVTKPSSKTNTTKPVNDGAKITKDTKPSSKAKRKADDSDSQIRVEKIVTETDGSVTTTTVTPVVIDSTAIREQILANLIVNMVYVEGGSFTMGATSEQGSDDVEYQKPAHKVKLSSFSIGKYEVTQEEWQAVMGNNPSEFKGAKHPVERVSWDDCQAFILKLNQLTGRKFRLPTEAEWEYAARGGRSSRGYKYAGVTSNLEGYAWYYDNSANTTHPVGQKSANELGLYDMSGNVIEWCADWYRIYSSSSQINPKGPSSGLIRVNRGGGWHLPDKYCRVSHRGGSDSNSRSSRLGLRLAL